MGVLTNPATKMSTRKLVGLCSAAAGAITLLAAPTASAMGNYGNNNSYGNHQNDYSHVYMIADYHHKHRHHNRVYYVSSYNRNKHYNRDNDRDEDNYVSSYMMD